VLDETIAKGGDENIKLRQAGPQRHRAVGLRARDDRTRGLRPELRAHRQLSNGLAAFACGVAYP
jgi:hypothetical protein